MSDGNGLQVANVPTEDEMGKAVSLFKRALDSIAAATQLAKDVEGLRGEVNALRSDLETERKRYASLEETLQYVRAQRDDAETKHREAQRELADTKHSLTQVNAKVEEQSREIQTKAEWIKALEEDNSNKTHNIRDLEREVDDLKAQLAGAVKERDETHESLLTVVKERDAAQEKLTHLRESYDRVFSAIATPVAAMESPQTQTEPSEPMAPLDPANPVPAVDYPTEQASEPKAEQGYPFLSRESTPEPSPVPEVTPTERSDERKDEPAQDGPSGYSWRY